MNIGDLVLRILADGSGLQGDVVKEAGKAGDAGAQTLGQKLGSGLKTLGVKAFGLAATAAFGIATKGALELEDVQLRIQSETGATADEARAMAATINRVAGDNQMALNDVAEAAIRVRRDLGATGEEADQLTEDFARFARVTRQDAAGAVEDFDDILDAWGLTAGDATGIQDKLLASLQKFGGSIEDRQAALSAMAPALRALNADVDDGIALLNLFAASGLDASTAQRALNTAVSKLPPGTDLEDVVRRLSAIKDPAERAKAAVEIFGARAGVGLANAIKPGMAGLEDFAITAEDAEGTVTKAADAIDSKWFGIPKLFSQAAATLRGIGAEAGPVLTALGGLASLGGTIFPDLGPALGRKITAGFKMPAAALKRIGVKVMGMIGLGVASSAASDVIGGAVADGVTGATRSGKLTGATDKLGSFLGTKLGKALSVAFAAVAVFEVIETWNRVQAELRAQSEQISSDVATQVATGTTAGLEQSRDALIEGIRKITAGGGLLSIVGNEARNQMIADLAAVEAELARRGSELPGALANGITRNVHEVQQAGTKLAGAVDMSAGLMLGEAHKLGRELPGEIGNGILARQAVVADAFDRLKMLMKSILTPMKEVGRTVGILTSKALARGLKDQRPEVRQQAQLVQSQAEADLIRLIKGGGKAGREAGKQLAKMLRDKRPEVRAAAQRIKEATADKLDETKVPAGNAGQRAGEAFLRRLKAAMNSGDFTVNAHVGFTMPGKAAGGPVFRNQPVVVGEKGWEVFVPEVDGRILSHAESVASASSGGAMGGGDTINVNVPVTGYVRAETPGELTARLRQVAAGGAISNPRRRRRVEVPTRG